MILLLKASRILTSDTNQGSPKPGKADRHFSRVRKRSFEGFGRAKDYTERLKAELGRLAVQESSTETPQKAFAALFNAEIEDCSEEARLSAFNSFLLHVTKEGNHDAVDELIIRNKDIGTDWRLYALGLRMYWLKRSGETISKEDRQKISQPIECVTQDATSYLREEGKNRNAMSFIVENQGHPINDMKVKMYAMASLLSMHASENLHLDERGLDYIFNVAEQAVKQVGIVCALDPFGNNANAALRFTVKPDNPPDITSFFGTIFHEITHRDLSYRLEVDTDSLHCASVHEFVCDLANHVKTYDLIDPSKDRLFQTAKELKYKKKSRIVHNDMHKGIFVEEHHIARAVLHDIFEESKKYKNEFYLSDLLRELYNNSYEILERYKSEGSPNNIQFPDFIKELVSSTDRMMGSKGLKLVANSTFAPVSKDELLALFKRVDPSMPISSKQAEQRAHELVRVPRIRIVRLNGRDTNSQN